jgi:hypothetical protein
MNTLPAVPNTGANELEPTISRQSQTKPRFADDNDHDNSSLEDGSAASSAGVVIDEKSKGVVEMEQLAERLSLKYYVLLYGSFALLAYCLSLSECRLTIPVR